MKINGLLIDLDGVLYIGNQPVHGAREALQKLREREVPMRFVTNTTTRTASEVVEKLNELGFEVANDEVFSAVSATQLFLQQQGHPKLHLLVRDSIREEFMDFPLDENHPDYVVVGDIGAAWSYDLMNCAFRQLMNGAALLAMHSNKFFQGEDGLRLDIGAFVTGLETVSGKKAYVVGKPSQDFFQLGLDSLGLNANEVAMIGDDIDSDVGGAQQAGLRGILVETGKYRAEHTKHSGITPDITLPSFSELPEVLST